MTLSGGELGDAQHAGYFGIVEPLPPRYDHFPKAWGELVDHLEEGDVAVVELGGDGVRGAGEIPCCCDNGVGVLPPFDA